ncbi:MAG: ribbon-helix-helix domain-containing protein [Lachnospiraceae bacterium]|nr:ribbon-helix-helix domain-containing protein [Lachnospiraceae bacterium]
MNKKKKESVPINVRLDTAINDRLDEYCEQYGVKKTFVVEKALTMYLDKQFEAQRIAKKLTDD